MFYLIATDIVYQIATLFTLLPQILYDVYLIVIDMKLDIEDCLAQVESCFNLLVPRFDIPDIYSSAESQDSSFELSPPHRGTEEAIGEEERKERKRTVSSAGSFVSLSSGEESDDDSGNEEVGETPSLAHTCTSSTNEQEKADEAVKDEDILRRLYTSSSTTSTSADGHVVKFGTTVSASSRKGKGKLKSDIAKELEGESYKDTGRGNSSDSDSDSSSDVEWEDVPMTGSHDQGAADLQEHGLMSRGFSIPITIELSITPEVRETEDNSSIIATLQECKQLLSEKYLPTINKWMEVGTIRIV